LATAIVSPGNGAGQRQRCERHEILTHNNSSRGKLSSITVVGLPGSAI
jgi:hypothetical protein